jgi:hypothetical protein
LGAIQFKYICKPEDKKVNLVASCDTDEKEKYITKGEFEIERKRDIALIDR